MTDSKYAHILMIVDRSGSMSSLRDAAEEGIQGFVTTQQELAKQGTRVTLSLLQFDDKLEWVDRMRVIADPGRTEQPAFSYYLKPRNSTALLDAIGKAVVEDGERLEALSEDGRPSKVVVVIMTDGRENSSREWSKNRITDLMKQQQDGYKWEFVFLSSDLSSVRLSEDMGIRNTRSFDNTEAGMRMSYTTSGVAVNSYLAGTTRSVELPEQLDLEK